jgi:quinol monooxygenase YgiN
MNSQEIVLLVKIIAVREHRADLVKLLTTITERSRISQGCLSYEVFRQADDDSLLILFQTWSTQEAFDTNWTYVDLPILQSHAYWLGAPVEAQKLCEVL